jgi:YesN/AraC family two-component response regulator
MNVIIADDEKWVRAAIVKTIPFEKLGLSLICEASNAWRPWNYVKPINLIF